MSVKDKNVLPFLDRFNHVCSPRCTGYYPSSLDTKRGQVCAPIHQNMQPDKPVMCLKFHGPRSKSPPQKTKMVLTRTERHKNKYKCTSEGRACPPHTSKRASWAL